MGARLGTAVPLMREGESRGAAALQEVGAVPQKGATRPGERG